ncbi:hypothetical protein WICMUC_004206 [Wickerhamomyces mucosus]|uniref:Uncharacterized protein n=1 Tax=Wickerhamomyces mucosus TaxID=1378264 RepID=A0A9P8PI97_9ASCO|nr:hypothetical protein WICMUC_004206 [Wickerhamomyces mucosus]
MKSFDESEFMVSVSFDTSRSDLSGDCDLETFDDFEGFNGSCLILFVELDVLLAVVVVVVVLIGLVDVDFLIGGFSCCLTTRLTRGLLLESLLSFDAITGLDIGFEIVAFGTRGLGVCLVGILAVDIGFVTGFDDVFDVTFVRGFLLTGVGLVDDSDDDDDDNAVNLFVGIVVESWDDVLERSINGLVSGIGGLEVEDGNILLLLLLSLSLLLLFGGCILIESNPSNKSLLVEFKTSKC